MFKILSPKILQQIPLKGQKEKKIGIFIPQYISESSEFGNGINGSTHGRAKSLRGLYVEHDKQTEHSLNKGLLKLLMGVYCKYAFWLS